MKKLLKVLAVAIGLIITINVFMFAFKICPPQGPWPMPPWCEDNKYDQSFQPTAAFFERPLFLGGIDQQRIPMISRDRLASLHAHALGWQGLSVENALFKMGSKQLISTANRLGMPVISSMNAIYLIRAVPISVPETAVVDLYGNPVPLADLNIVHGTYWRNLLNPQYQEMLLEDAKANIDVGVDGIVFDDPGTGSVVALIYDFGGSFDEYSMDGFRGFLKEKYSEQELKRRYGIEDIQSFHFGEYILQNNLQDKWNLRNLAPQPLTYEFEIFLSLANREVLQDIAEELKVYAAQQYNRDFYLSFNASPLFPGNFYAPGYDMVDFLYGEHFWFDQHHLKAAVAAKLAEGVAPGQFILLFEVKHDRGELPNPIGNLFKYAFADVYSTGNTSLQIAYPGAWTMRGWDYVEPLEYDDKVFEQYAGFLQNNPHLFGLEEPAKIAVVHSMISRRLSYMPIDPNLHHWGAPQRQSDAIIDMLLNLNVPFQMLVSGNDVTVNDVINEKDLSRYDMIILPNVLVMRDEEVDALVKYAQGGGRVLQINGFATLNPAGEKVNRSEIRGFAARTGEHVLKDGLWLTEDWGFDFEIGYLYGDRNTLPTEQSKDYPTLLRLGEIVEKHVPSDIKIHAPITVNVRRFVDGERIVLHFVNYDYDNTTDEFTPTEPVKVTINKRGLPIKSAKSYDLETGEIKEIELEDIGNNLQFVVPGIYAYTIVELQ